MHIYIVRKKHILVGLAAVILLFIVSLLYNQLLEHEVLKVFSNARKELPIYSVDTEEKKIAISFDAAWGSEKTEEILDILDQYKIKTTFFLVGFWVDKYPDKVKMIAERGHEIGNHSTTHPYMTKLSRDQMKMELETTTKKIKALTKQNIILFRPPYGDYNDLLINTCREEGYYVIQWDVDSLDWKEYGTDHMVNRVTNNVGPGSIVLFHNNAKYITQALPKILDKLISDGYNVVPISHLIYKENFSIDHTGRQKINDAES